MAAVPTPFTVHLPEAELEELRRRLDDIRWPLDPAGRDWSYGVGQEDLLELCARWRDFEWRATEQRINRMTHQQVVLDGHRIHVATVAPAGPSAGTVLLLHGWPSSFLEMIDLARELAIPNDGSQTAFTVVVPSLLGYGFSGPPPPEGFNRDQHAALLLDLMTALGHERFAVHAYDVSVSMGVRAALQSPERVTAFHTTEPGLAAPWFSKENQELRLTSEESTFLDYIERWEGDEGGYMALQRTRPQTLAYGLSDSPVALAAWLYEKWRAWTVPQGGSWDGSLDDVLLATLTLYWATNTISTANRMYAPPRTPHRTLTPEDQLSQAVGVLLTSQEIERAPRSLVERVFPQLRHWTDLDRYGHFVCAEAPAEVAASLRLLLQPARV